MPVKGQINITRDSETRGPLSYSPGELLGDRPLGAEEGDRTMPKKRFNSGRERRHAILQIIGLAILVVVTIGIGTYAFNL